MYRRTSSALYKIPKNMGVAPRYDVWNERYEPWVHMKRMGRLVGTGFYIPPEWYNHFRMFPPIQNNFTQERTLNPMNDAEPTQSDASPHLTAERIAVREELAHRSRLLASEGMRYYNIFWIEKPLDRMEKEYYAMKRQGVPHDVAIKKVLQLFYEELTVKKRVSAIQAEEAKLSGKFITMREATVVMQVLAQVHRDRLTPHQVSLLSKEYRDTAEGGDGLDARVTTEQHSAEAEEDTADGEESVMSADSLADFLADADGSGPPARHQVLIESATYDSVAQLQERAVDSTGEMDWYGGESPLLEVEERYAAGASMPAAGSDTKGPRGTTPTATKTASSHTTSASAKSGGSGGTLRNVSHHRNNNNNNNRNSNNRNSNRGRRGNQR